MYNQGQLKVANLLLKNKVFSFDKKYGMLSGFKFYFTAKVTGQRVMYHAGEPYDTIQLDVDVVEVSGPLAFGVFDGRKGKNYNRVEMLENRIHQSGFDYLMRDFASVMADMFKVLDSNVSTQVENLKFSENLKIEDPLSRFQVSEARVPRTMVRGIIQKIVNTLKKKQEGEYYFPFMSGGEEYNVIVDVRFNDEIESARDFDLQPYYNTETGDIEILIQIDPDRLEKSLYSIVGELNDDLTHEFQHSRQSEEGRLEDEEDFYGSNFEYFMQPAEIEAQYFGLKQKAKSMGLPMKDVIDDWFMFRQDKFELTDDEVAKIKNAVLHFDPSRI
jgi:hypothetical protein